MIWTLTDAAAGTVNVDAGGTITVADGLAGVSALAGQIELDATGINSNIAVNASVLSTTGDINVLADNDVTFDATSDITSTSGNVVVTADTDGAADSGGSDQGALTMADGAIINAGTGTVDMDANEDVSVSTVTTSNTVDATSAVGAIVDNTAAEAANISGSTLDLDAATGIGSGGTLNGAGDLDINGSLVSAVNTTSGNINITEVDSIALDDITNTGRPVIIDAGAAITDGNGADTINILAGSAELRAITGIGQ